MVINTKELARLLGVTVRRVQQLKADFGLPAVGRGKYDDAAAIQWYIEWRTRDDVEDSDLTEERRKLTISQRHKVDLEAARMRGELIPAEDVANAFNELAVIVATQHDGIAGRLAGPLSGLDDPGEVAGYLTEELREIRVNIANHVERFADTVVIEDDGLDHTAAA